MKNFIKKTSLFLIGFIIIITGIFRINNNSFRINSIKYNDRLFYKKFQYFSDFIQQNDKINLILGSSLIEDSLIPDSLGRNWFSFTSGFQSIYESYKFLDFYKDKLVIDTIIVALQPFDFPKSHVQHYNNDGRSLNGNFYIFGEDSITSLKRERSKNRFKKIIQLIKDENFFDSDHIIKKLTYSNKKPLEDVWTTQGFSGRINAVPVDLDKLYLQFSQGIKMKGSTFNRHVRYFENVEIPPNLHYFNLFHSLSKSINTKIIYLLTPKSKYYHKALEESNYDKTWDIILDSLKSKNIDLWNYENFNTDSFEFHFFWDETHISHDGAKLFTKIIKTRF